MSSRVFIRIHRPVHGNSKQPSGKLSNNRASTVGKGSLVSSAISPANLSASASVACPRCLQFHVAPSDSNSNTRRWWCSQRPATRRERILYYNKIRDEPDSEPVPNSTGSNDTSAEPRSTNRAVALGAKKPCRDRSQRRPDMAIVHDDPVGEGIDLAHDATLPDGVNSDKSEPPQSKELHFATGEKYLDVETMLTMADIRHKEPTYSIKTVPLKRRKGKKTKKASGSPDGDAAAKDKASDAESDDSDEYDFVHGVEDDDDVLSVAEWGDLD